MTEEDLLSEPLTGDEIAAFGRFAELNPDEYVAGDRTLTYARIAATLDAARSATPSSKEAGLREIIESAFPEDPWVGVEITTESYQPPDECPWCRRDKPRLVRDRGVVAHDPDCLWVRARAALATPDNAGRSSIDELRAAIRRFLTIDDALPEKRDGSEWEDRPTEDWDAALREWREARDDLDARLSESTGSEGGAS